MDKICYRCKFFGLLDEYTGDGICRLREKKDKQFIDKDGFVIYDPFVYDGQEACIDFIDRGKKNDCKM